MVKQTKITTCIFCKVVPLHPRKILVVSDFLVFKRYVTFSSVRICYYTTGISMILVDGVELTKS